MIAVGRAFRRLTPADRRLVVEATVFVVLVRLCLGRIPFMTLRGALGGYVRTLGRRVPNRGAAPARVTWAVGAVTARLPFHATCLVEGLVAQAMLERLGFPAALRIGVRHRDDVRLDAHAWVECEGAVVIGTIPALTEYAVLAPRT